MIIIVNKNQNHLYIGCLIYMYQVVCFCLYR